LKHLWYKIDNDYLKPFLLHDWPKSKHEHDHIAIKVKRVFKEFQRERKKSQLGSQMEEIVFDE
jgi:hypothetical protein